MCVSCVLSEGSRLCKVVLRWTVIVPSFSCGQFRQNLVCMLATWNSLNGMNKFTFNYICIFICVGFYACFFFSWRTISTGQMAPHYRIFTITLRHNTVRLLWASYWSNATTSKWQHTTLTREIPMTSAEFEPATPASEPPQTHVLNVAATNVYILHSMEIYW